MSERDLFKAIVLSGVALVVPGCSSPTTPVDTGTTPQNDAATIADAGSDAAPVAEDAGADDDHFVAIL